MTLLNKSILLAAAMMCAAYCPGCAEGWETDGSSDPGADDADRNDDPTQDPDTDAKSTIQLSTADGKESDELTATCHGFLCLSGETMDTNLHFVLPSRYRRHTFSKSIDPNMSAGGSAE